jgi:hypothetical protein
VKREEKEMRCRDCESSYVICDDDDDTTTTRGYRKNENEHKEGECMMHKAKGEKYFETSLNLNLNLNPLQFTMFSIFTRQSVTQNIVLSPSI